ncbi:YoaK family protein [Nakamurella leprariae]|uniref:DUF1275 domain-containing protein n=1 Tax=Nakamurella leprariae TaxID=2803911 RepID=A0A939C0L3_9ACTN|nr:YoaK family protein [Nakamurella leprariae]MBM9468881.1 DUF1275 domain-containing protein [Nakamurella leprariae]
MTTTHDRATTGPGRLPLALSVVAGLTDVTTFVLLHGVFSAHITGNLVVLAADVGTGRSVNLASVLAIPCFVAVAALVTAVITRSARPAASWTVPLLTAQAVLLAGAAAVGIGFRVSTHPGTALAAITGLLAVAAMAVQNALLHVAVPGSPTTAVMTGNVVEATVAGVRVLLGRAGSRSSGRGPDPADRAAWRRTWPLLTGFLAGCLVGAAVCGAVDDLGSLAPFAAALVVVLVPALRNRTAVRAPADRTS